MLIVVGTKALSAVLKFARASLNGKDRDVKFECFEEKQVSEEEKRELEKKKLQESTLLAVTCPPNVQPGQMVQIRISSQQQLIQARVPPNVKAGQIFHVRNVRARSARISLFSYIPLEWYENSHTNARNRYACDK